MEYLRVEQGLNVLAGISKSIRDGNVSSVPGIFRNASINLGNDVIGETGSSIEQGANSVLSEVGINPTLLAAFGISTNVIVDTAISAAQNVFTNVVNGSFDFSDILGSRPPFDAATDLLKNQSTKNPFDDGRSLNPSPYATDKSLMDNHPKFKFLFVVEIIFEDDFEQDLTKNANNMAFVVRTASRPNINIEYEDINMYNFRTKVAKFTEYQPITMSFFDDQSNQTTSFYKKYSELMIPNMQMPETTIPAYETSSFNFSTKQENSPYNSSSLQPLTGKSGHKNIIKTIRLFHIWGWGQFVNVYKFHNPKITEINISDLDMDSNDLSEIEIQFSYDGLNIQTTTDTNENISLDPKSSNNGNYDIPQYSTAGDRGHYPLHYNGDSSQARSMHGINSQLNENTQKLSSDMVDIINRSKNAPDSEFLGTTPTDSFPDFNTLLSGGIDLGTNLLGASSNLNKITNTLNVAKSVFGNSIPNVNNITKLFS